MHSDDHEQAATDDDRRRYHAVRSIFGDGEAVERIRPLIDPDNSWTRGTVNHFACRTLRETCPYPKLSPLEIHVLVTAAERCLRGERSHASPAL